MGVYSDRYGGTPRWLEKRFCNNPNCGKEFLAAKHRKTKYCSQTCQGEHKTSKNSKQVHCDTCGIAIVRSNSKLKSGKHSYNFARGNVRKKLNQLMATFQIYDHHII